MSAKVILIWFRNDLRTLDNEVLFTAVQKSDFIIPVYIFDPRYYETNKYGFLNTGDCRKEYIKQTVFSLKQKLQSLGGDLLTYEGYPEEIIPHLVQKYDVDEVYHHREVAQRETNISDQVEIALWNVKRNLKHFIAHTLFHKEDLPFPIRDIPNDFNTFKKKVSKESVVRASLPDIENISIPPHLEKTDFDFSDVESCAMDIEQLALNTLHEIVFETNTETDLFYKIEPFLAIGSLSPIVTYHFLNTNLNPSNKKVITELIDNLFRRDYFRFMLKKHPNCYFINKNEEHYMDSNAIKNWTLGNTEDDYVNSTMLKLNSTGILNEEELVYIALHFIYELNQNWLIGASWCEQQLIDFAPATNYGYWAHFADQGTSIKNNKTKEDWLKLKSQKVKLFELS